MAGDWIKMRVDLSDDPAVISMAATLQITEDEIVGKLHRLWSWADRHTTDGVAAGITPTWIDKYVGRVGFAEAMKVVGWIAFENNGVVFPNFDKHNGKSAKTRCENAIRQRMSRKTRDNNVTDFARANVSPTLRRSIFERDGYTCAYCGTESDQVREEGRKALLSVDHIIPKSRGGATIPDNLVCCCRLCNREKNDRTPTEWNLLPAFLQPGITYDSASHKICDNRVTREEKRREENIQKTPIVPLKGTEKGPLQARAAAMFRRRPETPFTAAEDRVFKKNAEAIKATTEEDWRLLEAFYAAPQAETFARKDLATLVNNWNGEIDRARHWRPTAPRLGVNIA